MFYNNKSQNPTGNQGCPVFNPMPITIKTKSAQGRFNFPGGVVRFDGI